jgi:hypothetical protein
MWEVLAWFVLILAGFMLLNAMWVWLFIRVEARRMNILHPVESQTVPFRKTRAKAA